MIWAAALWKGALSLARAVPWQAWLVAAIVAVAVVYHLHAVNAAYTAGAADYKAKVEAANKLSNDKANQGEAAVRNCRPPRRWVRETGKCENAN